MPLYSPATMSNIAVLLGPFEFPLLVLRTKRKKIIWVQAEGLWEAVTVANSVCIGCVSVPAHDPTDRLGIFTSSWDKL